MSADPPESAPGTGVRFEVLAVDADGANLVEAAGVSVRWTTCLSVAEIIRASGLGFGLDLEDDCGEGGADLYELQTEGLPPGQALLPPEAFAPLAMMLENATTTGTTLELPDGADPRLLETLALVVTEVGVALRVRVEFRRDGELIATGFKRFAVTSREEVTTNPPPPRFAVDGVWLSARGGTDPHICVPEQGTAPTVTAAADLDLQPDPDDEVWMESYPVFNFSGSLQTNRESAYYSWFVMAGEISEDISQAPERDVVHTAPEEPGRYPLWLVVRDGHLGIVWCRAELDVR